MSHDTAVELPCHTFHPGGTYGDRHCVFRLFDAKYKTVSVCELSCCTNIVKRLVYNNRIADLNYVRVSNNSVFSRCRHFVQPIQIKEIY